MNVAQKFKTQRRNLNGSEKEYHKSVLKCMAQPDPMLSMLEWLCAKLMEAEVSQQLGAEKSKRSNGRSGYRCGYRPRPLYEKACIDGRIVSMAVLVVCGVDERGLRDILAVEPMLEESEDSCLLLFRTLQ